MNGSVHGQYSTGLKAASSTSPTVGTRRDGWTAVTVPGVNLVGVCVTAFADLNVAEHQRRVHAGLEAVTDPALLDRLLDLPIGVPIADPMTWTEMASYPAGIADRDRDGATITRLLEPPLTIENVVVTADSGRELWAVQDASLFAGFTRRWVAAGTDRVPSSAVLEAKLCGVGILDRCGEVLLECEAPAALTIDQWTWLLQEKTYRRWLRQSSRAHGQVSPVRPTGEAIAPQGC